MRSMSLHAGRRVPARRNPEHRGDIAHQLPPAAAEKGISIEAEADKIRDAGVPPARESYCSRKFASDQAFYSTIGYEFAHSDPKDEKRAERLNALINSYAGCVDDATDLIRIGIEKQEDIRIGVKALQGEKRSSRNICHT